MTALCPSKHERQVISGTYHAKGVFGDNLIYEKNVADANKQWWSLRFDSVTGRWIFMYLSRHIRVGNTEFGSIIQNCTSNSVVKPMDAVIRENEAKDCTFEIELIAKMNEN